MIQTHSKPILSEVIAELKVSVVDFATELKGESSYLDNLLTSLINNVNINDTSLSVSSLVTQFRRKRSLFLKGNREQSRRVRADISLLINKSLKKDLSTNQRDMLMSLISKINDEKVSNHDVSVSLGEALLMLSSDIEMARAFSERNLSNNYNQIKKNPDSVITADVLIQSQILINEIQNIVVKLKSVYPQNRRAQLITSQSADLANKPNLLLFSIDLLRSLNETISEVIEEERRNTHKLLKCIQDRIIEIFMQSDAVSSSIDDSQRHSDSIERIIKKNLDVLKIKADNSSDTIELQNIIIESVTSISEAVNTFSKKQKQTNTQSKNQINALKSKLEDAKRSVSKAKGELKIIEKEILIDDLSQTGNRKAYAKKIKELHELWKKDQQNLSIIVLDVDNFKTINDTYGHTIGDQVIKKIASIIKEESHELSHVSRYGGEEFVIICNKLSLNEAKLLAEKVRKAISLRKFKIRGSEKALSVTASFGVCEFSSDHNEPESVFDMADKAMYEVKAQGKNKVAFIKNGEILID